jgi:hypothetical protein
VDPAEPRTRGLLRATVSGDGRLGPIEERIGRRLVRLVDPQSKEGARLLGSGTVDLLGPDGERFGCVEPGEVRHRLKERLERRLVELDDDDAREALLEGLRRLDAWYARVGHG